MAGFQTSRALQSLPPDPWPRSGQTGMPDSAPTMTVSRLTQRTATEEDIEHWMGDPDDPDDRGATFDPPYDISHNFTDYGTPNQQVYGESMDLLRQFIYEVLTGEVEEKEGEEKDEASSIGGGAIRGHIGPLGSNNRDPKLSGKGPRRKKNQKSYEPSMRAFGGGKEV